MGQSQPFDHVAQEYDATFTDTQTGQLQRLQVYSHLDKFLQSTPNQHVIEINCGTGADACWLVEQGHRVLATDISTQMLEQVERKRAQLVTQSRVLLETTPVSATELLQVIPKEQKFDLLFSNFGGLNCLSPKEIAQFLEDAAVLVRPRGHMALVIMGRFCWWETLYFIAKRKFREAFRRRAQGPVQAKLDDKTSVNTWYYSPRQIRMAGKSFRTIQIHPIGFWLPPSYLDSFFESHPMLLSTLNKLEQKTSKWSFLAQGADHYLIILQNI